MKQKSDTQARILLVDDQEQFTDTMKKVLENQGFSVKTANSGEAALDRLSEDSFDLLITDINMPGMDGIELIRKVRENNTEVQIIVVTGFPSHESQKESFKMGAINYVVKPFKTERLLEIISKSLEESEEGVKGAVELSTIDLVQMYALNNKTTALEIQNGKNKGSIYFDRGKVIHAETDDKQGKEAFNDMLRWKSGSFSTKPIGDKEIPVSIHQSVDTLLVEGAYEFDEESMSKEEKKQQIDKNKEDYMATLDEILQEFRGKIAEFVSTDVVEIASGLSIGGGSIYPDFDANIAAAAYSDVVKANERAIEALGGEPALGNVEDILITTEKSYVLLVVYPGKKYYHGLAITKNGNLGMARVTMKKYMSDIIAVIPN